jgi:hypothetical protein
MGKHLCAGLLAEGIEALAAQLLQLVAFSVAQLDAADPAVVAIAIGGAASCQATPWPSSSNRCAEAFG